MSESKYFEPIVTNEEVLSYDGMIRKTINEQILRYWSRTTNIDSGQFNITVARMGLGLEDLMQMGRVFVLQQLRWFKKNGKTGVNSAKESTLMYTLLRNRFQSFSRTFANMKHGGSFIGANEGNAALGNFTNYVRSRGMTLNDTLQLLNKILDEHGLGKEYKKVVERGLYRDGELITEKFSTAESVVLHVEQKMRDMEPARFIYLSGGDGESLLIDGNDPEKQYLYMEEHGMTENNNDLIGSATFTKKDRQKSKLNGRGKSFKLMVLARAKGFETQGEVARELGISMSALSNILHARSQGTAAFQNKVQATFGAPISELREVVSVPTTTAAAAGSKVTE